MTKPERIRMLAETLVYEVRRLLSEIPQEDADRFLDWLEAQLSAVRRATGVPEGLHRQKPVTIRTPRKSR